MICQLSIVNYQLEDVQQELSYTVYQKLQKLLKEHEQLRKDNRRLQQQLEEQQAVGSQHQQKVNDLETQIALLKASTGGMDAAAKKDMGRRINQYIKDIDHAILLLNE